jgi:hypothetical protein
MAEIIAAIAGLSLEALRRRNSIEHLVIFRRLRRLRLVMDVTLTKAREQRRSHQCLSCSTRRIHPRSDAHSNPKARQNGGKPRLRPGTNAVPRRSPGKD